MHHIYDAVIVGAGPAGSSAAIRLAQAGWSVAIVEKQEFPRRKVCGECIAATNFPLLDAMGVGVQFDRMAGSPLRKMGLFSNSHGLLADLPAFARGNQPWGRVLSRERFDTLLLQRARDSGAEVWQPYTVKRVVRDASFLNTCAVTGSRGKTITYLSAPVVLDAHGSWENDPITQSRPVRTHRRSDLFAFKATYRLGTLHSGVLPLLAFPGGYGGMVRCGHDQETLAFCLRRDVLRQCREQFAGYSAARAAHAYVTQCFANAREVLPAGEPLAPWLAVGPILPGVRSPWRGGGIFALGNAAGEAHPILGEGISMAIQSAWMLCDLLISRRDALMHGRAGGEIGLRYTARWRRHFTTRLIVAATFAHLAMRPPLTATLLPVFERIPELLTIGARWGAKVRSTIRL